MESIYEYEPVRFNSLLSDIRAGYLSVEESASINLTDKITCFLMRLTTEYGDSPEQFVSALKSSELELIPHVLKGSDNLQTNGILADILRLRFRKKLFELNWAMLQTDYTSKNLLDAMKILSGCMKEMHPDEFAGSILSRLEDWDGYLIEKANDLLIEEGIDIRAFFRKYSIQEDSLFGKKLCALFFLKCEKEGFLNNRKTLLMYMGRDSDDSPAAVCGCYLEKFAINEYFDDVNQFILDEWGIPEKDEVFWEQIGPEIRDKFILWLDLIKIERHFGKAGKRYGLWAGYFESMVNIEADDAVGLLILDFERFTVVDTRDEDSSSYIYDKKYFRHEFEQYVQMKEEGNPVWRIIPEHVTDARDLVINGVKSEIYRVGYDRVQILYLKEILKVEIDKTIREKYF